MCVCGRIRSRIKDTANNLYYWEEENPLKTQPERLIQVRRKSSTQYTVYNFVITLTGSVRFLFRSSRSTLWTRRLNFDNGPASCDGHRTYFSRPFLRLCGSWASRLTPGQRHATWCFLSNVMLHTNILIEHMDWLWWRFEGRSWVWFF